MTTNYGMTGIIGEYGVRNSYLQGKAVAGSGDTGFLDAVSAQMTGKETEQINDTLPEIYGNCSSKETNEAARESFAEAINNDVSASVNGNFNADIAEFLKTGIGRISVKYSYITEKSISNQSVSETGNVGIVSTKDMTMEEYKQYIHDKISQIPMHPTRMQESISINISESGFEAMKNDPEYEAWVLNDLRIGWAQPDRWSGVCGGAYSTIYYGATKEECHAEMWSAGFQNGSGKSLFDSKAKDSFWERRVEQKKRIEAQAKKRHEEYVRLNEEAARKRMLMKQEANKRYYKSSIAKEAIAAYDKNIMEAAGILKLTRIYPDLL